MTVTGTARARAVDVPAGVRAGRVDARALAPLVLRPDGDASVDAVVGWLEANRAWVADTLAREGAIRLEGFAVRDAHAFEEVARSIDPDLKRDYVGTSPRDAFTDHVFSASELPPHYPVPPHCEMSFVRTPPRHLFFWCDVANEGPGGETPLTDVRRVWADLPADVRERFATRGVTNIRNYAGPDGGDRFDLWKLKPWHDMFGTTDRAEVEASCARNGFEPTWLPGGRLRLVNTQPAAVEHPVTGELAWFNHAQVFHLSSVPDEYAHIARRQRWWPSTALRAVATVAVALKRRGTPLLDQAMHCTYGDGSPIPDADMHAVRAAFWKNMVFPRWAPGDVVAIDNHAVAHGRMPYRGPRRIGVAWA